ncbi:MAG: hypothetical protein IPQ25_16995 [Chitinophagaceae bacterium]|nr:hypothetical protein [Chitinophagaceae bacterium]
MWTRQPQYPARIDQSNPLTRGLIAAVNPASGIDHVSGTPINWTGNAKRTVCDGSVCVSTEGYGTNIYAYANLPSKTYTSLTGVAITTPRSVSTNLSVLQFGSTTNGAPIFSIRSGYTTASKMRFFVRDDNYQPPAAETDSSATAFVAGKRVVVGMEATSRGGSLFAYINGVRDSATTTSNANAYDYTLDRIGLNCLSNVDGNEDFWDGESGLFLLWDRLLTLDEHARIAENPWQVFAEEKTAFLRLSVVSVQLQRPVSDVSAGTWTASTGSDLYAMLDETSVNDADYIVTTGASTCEVALGSLTDPAVSTGHKVRYRLSANTGGITVRLREGTTTIATWTHNPAPSALTTYEQTLTGGEADSITNYAALKLQFEATT